MAKCCETNNLIKELKCGTKNKQACLSAWLNTNRPEPVLCIEWEEEKKQWNIYR